MTRERYFERERLEKLDAKYQDVLDGKYGARQEENSQDGLDLYLEYEDPEALSSDFTDDDMIDLQKRYKIAENKF